jgi:hypothetical protein
VHTTLKSNVALMVFVPLSILALGVPASARTVALVIGNGAYSGDNRLKNPPNDAVAVEAALKRLHFDKVIMKLNLGGQALQNEIAAFARDLRKEDTAFVYYSGHGIGFDEDNYLVPVDIGSNNTPADIKFKSYSVKLLLDNLAVASQRVVILDACRSNPSLEKSLVGKGLVAASGRANSVIAYATQPGKTALENDGESLSLFTKYFLSRLAPDRDLVSILQDVKQDVFKASGRFQQPSIAEEMVSKLFLGGIQPHSDPALSISGTARSNPDFSPQPTTPTLLWVVWENPHRTTQLEALNYCRNLSYDGSRNWRLPTIHELKSIIDQNHLVTDQAEEIDVWSSSTIVIDPYHGAWFYDFSYDGSPLWDTVDGPIGDRTLCVRGEELEILQEPQL